MKNTESTFLFVRHTQKTKRPEDGSSTSDEFYAGITEEGEQLVREKTREHLLSLIEESAPGSVVIFAGASDLPRTKSSTRVSVNELRNIFAERTDEYLVLDEKDINSMVDKKTESTRNVLSETVAANPEKKVILSYPLFLKEFSLVTPESGTRASEQDWKTGGAKEEWTPYLTELMKIANDDEDQAVRTWINNGGKITTADGKILEGPNPVGVAREYINALKRLDNITKELFPRRPRVVEATAHSWDIDVFIAYATHGGKLDVSAYEEIAKGADQETSIISEFEFPVIKLSDTSGTLEYRGRTYPINAPELADDAQAKSG